jgi:hypothetical protein
MQELLNLLNKYQITPNQLILLHCIQEKIRPDGLLPNLQGEIILSQRGEWITPDNLLQPKAILLLSEADTLFKVNKKKKSVFNTEEFNNNLNEFREIFPKGILPSGKAARSSLSELKKKMSKFFTDYPEYDWDLVLDATTYYVEHYKKQSYMYMKTAGYFISKNDESELASYCQTILDGADVRIVKKSQYNVA